LKKKNNISIFFTIATPGKSHARKNVIGLVAFGSSVLTSTSVSSPVSQSLTVVDLIGC
jgi:hypothetical protein